MNMNLNLSLNSSVHNSHSSIYLRIRGHRISSASVIRLQAASSRTSLLGRPLELLAEKVASIVGTGRRVSTLRLLRGRHCVRILAIAAIGVHRQVPEQILQQDVRLGIALSLRRRFQLRAVCVNYGRSLRTNTTTTTGTIT